MSLAETSTAAVQQGEEWVEVEMLTHLGNMCVMNKPKSATRRSMTVRITSHSGDVYGVYEAKFTCQDECMTPPGLDAPAERIVSTTCSVDDARV